MRAIVELAEGLGLSVIPEGIEVAAQVAALRRLGCRIGQGFYFARPLAAAELESFVRENRGLTAA